MTYVITQGCCNDASCVAVCPVQCIRPRPGDPDFTTAEQLYIDPATCIDCGACMDECPVDAVQVDYDLPDHLAGYLDINAEYFVDRPVVEEDPPRALRRVLPEGRETLRVAVVGTGPAGLYVALQLSVIKGVHVSLFERLPTPLGLVRAGVAPDHAATKGISQLFSSVMSRSNVSCFFNVEIGRDLGLSDVRQTHDAVVWAAGASSDRRLGIEGEDLPGVLSAREFVAWYNGHPDHADSTYDLSSKRAVIIGNGNVALDVARTLARPIEVFERSDMADHAIEALRKSAVEEVFVVARRGPKDARFTSGEIAAFETLDGVDLLAEPTDGIAADDSSDAAHTRRKLQVVGRAAHRQRRDGRRSITLRFGLTPLRVEGDTEVSSVVFGREPLATDDQGERRSDVDEIVMETSLVFRAIGYHGEATPGLPFDEARGIIPNDAGRVLDLETGTTLAGVYCTGWIRRGPSGGIGANRECAREVVASLFEDLQQGFVPQAALGAEDLTALVADSGVEVVDGAGWSRINASERASGRSAGRPAVKLVSVADLLAASRLSSAGG